LIDFSVLTSRRRSKTARRRVLVKTKFVSGIILIRAVQIGAQKYSPFGKSEIVSMLPLSRASQEGRFAIVTNVGAGCGGRGSVGRAS